MDKMVLVEMEVGFVLGMPAGLAEDTADKPCMEVDPGSLQIEDLVDKDNWVG